MPKFTPREYQDLIADHILNVRRGAVWAGMGMGKTSATLYALSILDLLEPGPWLVIAPKRVAQSVWPAEVEKWDNFRGMRVAPIVGSVEERLHNFHKKADLYTINYENIPWLVEQAKKLGRWRYRTIIADESTKLKGFRLRGGGRRALDLKRVCFVNKDSRFIELTGTPSPNGLMDLWGQAYFIDKGQRLGRTLGSFKKRWFYRAPSGGPFAPLIPAPFAQAQIQKALSDVTISLDAKDWFDLKEPIINTVYCDLPPKAMGLYKEMERAMYMELESGEEIEAFNAASKTMKCMQLANGAVYTDDKGTWEPIHDTKLDALESVIEEAAGMPVLVAYHFKSDLARLKKKFPQGRELDADPTTIDRWNAGKIPVLFAHPASAGHGLNLQDGGNILAVFGHWWDLEQYQQIVERIGPTRQAQAGYDRPVFIYHIVARGTLDEVVIQRRESKRSLQDLLLESMRKGQ